MRVNDIDLHVEVDGHGPPLLLIHGFTGSTRAWDEIRADLTANATVVGVDVIGHGRSACPPDHARYTLGHASRDLAAILETLDVDRADVLGYSMGGRIALHFATSRPDRVRRLILESASPGIQDGAERARRADSDNQLAERILRDGIPAFVAEWEQQPLLRLAAHVPEDVRAAQHARRLDNSPVGLANSLRGMGAGQQTPLWTQLGELSMPVHLVVGGDDARYCAIGERMYRLLPNATLTVVDSAGHTAHLDQPAAFVKSLHCALSTN